MRTCDGAGVEELWLCGITPTPPHEKLAKTALGAEQYVTWRHFTHTTQAVTEVQSKSYQVRAVEQHDTAKPYYQVEYPDRTALVFGHEITGVHPNVLQAVDGIIELPMLGNKNSLNVATTVGILVYHVRFKDGK